MRWFGNGHPHRRGKLSGAVELPTYFDGRLVLAAADEELFETYSAYVRALSGKMPERN